MSEYIKTDLSKILPVPDLNDNNFTDIFKSFDEKFKDYKFQISLNDNQFQDENIFKSASKTSNENIKEPKSNSNSKTVEILDNGSVEIKNNDDIIINNNEINVSNFDNEEENKQKNDKMFLNFDSNEKKKINFNNINNIQMNNFDGKDNQNQNKKKYLYDLKPLLNPEQIPEKYQKTDISKILKTIDNEVILENFKQMLDSIFNPNPNNYNNSNSSRVRLNLESSYKKNKNQMMDTIREEDNESYDSLSLQKSIRSSAKATPNLKKKSFNDIPNLNISNNLFKSFSKEKSNSNNNIDDNIMIEENNLENNENAINNIIINPEKKENKIMVIDLNPNSENKNDINYTTPESKEKTIEKIYNKVKDINEERNKNSGPKEFSNFENDDMKFSDFNPSLNEEEKIEKNDNKNIIIINNNINIIGSNNSLDSNNEIKINNNSINNNIQNKKEKLFEKISNFIVSDKKDKKILFLGDKNLDDNKKFQIYYYSYRRILQLCFNIKLPLDKQYEKFIKKLMNKLPIINNKDILLQKNQIENNNKINMDINNIEDKIKNLREYFHQKIKLSELKSKNNMKKTNKNVGIFNKKKEIELNLDNLLYELKTKEKDNYFYYVSKIKNILEKNKYIEEKEISNAKNKLEKNELVLLKNKSDISTKINKFEKTDKMNIYNFLIVPAIVIIIASIFLGLNVKNDNK